MDDQELTACLRLYGLRMRGTARPLVGGYVGSTVAVDTKDGQLVVKRFGSRFDSARTLLAAQAQRHAALAGLAPDLRLTLDGELTVTIDGSTYMLTEHIDNPRPAESVGLACALAALHVRLETFRPSGRDTDFLELSDPPGAGLERLLEQVDDTAHREVLEWRLRVLADHGLSAVSPESVPRDWVHGDASPDNLLVGGPHKRHLFIDFDQVSRFPRAYETVRAYAATVNTELPPHQLASTFRAFLNAYHAVNPVSKPDRMLMIDLYITVQAGETRSFTTPDGEVRGMQSFAHARHRKLAWIVEHRDLLRSVAEEARS